MEEREPEFDEDGNMIERASALGVIAEGEEGEDDRESPDKEEGE
jgi:hypothetical protein